MSIFHYKLTKPASGTAKPPLRSGLSAPAGGVMFRGDRSMRKTGNNIIVGSLEIAGMVLILISFYYQAFYEGDSLKYRYDNIRFKLDLIEREVVHNSDLIGGQSDYNLGNYWKKLNEDRLKFNDMSEEHVNSIDRINSLVSSIKAWIFIVGSFLLIVSKYLQYFLKESEGK